MLLSGKRQNWRLTARPGSPLARQDKAPPPSRGKELERLSIIRLKTERTLPARAEGGGPTIRLDGCTILMIRFFFNYHIWWPFSGLLVAPLNSENKILNFPAKPYGQEQTKMR